MQTFCGRTKLKANCLDKVYAWAKELNDRSSEAYETMANEGVFVECSFLEKAADGEYLIYFIKCESIAKMREVSANSKHSLDIFHREFRDECCDGGVRLETLIDFDRNLISQND